jgi:hypothetical protein
MRLWQLISAAFSVLRACIRVSRGAGTLISRYLAAERIAGVQKVHAGTQRVDVWFRNVNNFFHIGLYENKCHKPMQKKEACNYT